MSATRTRHVRENPALVPKRFSKMTGTIITPGRADAFIEAIATGSEDIEAAEFAGVKLSAVRERARKDPAFKAAYAIARANRIEFYRREAKRRAIDGWLEPVYHRGEQVGVIRRHSDRMLEMLLRAEDPDTFGDRKVVEILTSPMTGGDVQRALEAGRQPGAAEILEQVAALFADQAVLEAVSAPDEVDGEWEPA